MQDRQGQSTLVIRQATSDDYPAFCRLFPELLVDDPVPSLERWISAMFPSTWIAARGPEVLGYCHFQEYADTGYVRNVVVAPGARRSGVGCALMHATAECLRFHGKRFWRLNVKPDNRAALALYHRMGMQTKYLTKSLLLPWTTSKSLPKGDGMVQDILPEHDADVEGLFDLPRGQLASARRQGRILIEAISNAGQSTIGLSVFDPKFPGAFPFRVKEIDAVMPLLNAMRKYVPMDEYVNIVAEDDERLANLLMSVGASIKHEIFHMEGTL